MSTAKGRSDLQPVYQPTTLPLDTRGRSYCRPPTNPTGQMETPRVFLICREMERRRMVIIIRKAADLERLAV